MFIQDYISKDFPAFRISDSIEEACETAKEFGYSHVFITKNNAYAGALSQSFLEESPEGDLGSLEIHFEKFAIVEDGNILDTIKLFHSFYANVVPVIGKNENYVGYTLVMIFSVSFQNIHCFQKMERYSRFRPIPHTIH